MKTLMHPARYRQLSASSRRMIVQSDCLFACMVAGVGIPKANHVRRRERERTLILSAETFFF